MQKSNFISPDNHFHGLDILDNFGLWSKKNEESTIVNSPKSIYCVFEIYFANTTCFITPW